MVAGDPGIPSWWSPPSLPPFQCLVPGFPVPVRSPRVFDASSSCTGLYLHVCAMGFRTRGVFLPPSSIRILELGLG